MHCRIEGKTTRAVRRRDVDGIMVVSSRGRVLEGSYRGRVGGLGELEVEGGVDLEIWRFGVRPGFSGSIPSSPKWKGERK